MTEDFARLSIENNSGTSRTFYFEPVGCEGVVEHGQTAELSGFAEASRITLEFLPNGAAVVYLGEGRHMEYKVVVNGEVLWEMDEAEA